MRTKASSSIFLVDDDPFCINLYKRHLQNMGFKSISCFTNGQELVENLSLNPDIIFLDYHLDDSVGIELLDKIKAFNPEIYVVMVSGQSDMEVTVNLLNKGAFDYIIKDDYETDKISKVIGKWMASCEYSDKINAGTGEESSQKFMKVLIEAQDKVRKEISGELHDNVNQLLGATKLYMETACRDEKNRLPLIIESKGIIETAISEIRKLSHSLHSANSNDCELEENLIKMVDGLKAQHKYNVDAEINLDNANEILSTEIQQNVLRIAQELINNTVKYSCAKKIQIILKFHCNNLLLKISDDGVGFNKESVKKGLGLSNITERLLKLNGTYMLNSAPGQGCQWEISVPVTKN